MNYLNLIWQNLRYYRRSHFTVLAGVVVATAVLTGALMVGDSVRYSLKRITGQRLGSIRYVVHPGSRVFRQQLAAELQQSSGVLASPILVTGGIAIQNETNSRINRVAIIGIDETFSRFWPESAMTPYEGEAILNQHCAARLGVKPGDAILVRLDPLEKVSRNAPFVPDRNEPVAIHLRVKAIADDYGYGRFSLRNEQAAPLNIFVSIRQLANRMHLQGMANGIVMTDGAEGLFTEHAADSVLQQVWTIDDGGLLIRKCAPSEEPDHLSYRDPEAVATERIKGDGNPEAGDKSTTLSDRKQGAGDINGFASHRNLREGEASPEGMKPGTRGMENPLDRNKSNGGKQVPSVAGKIAEQKKESKPEIFEITSDQIFLNSSQEKAIRTVIPGAGPILTYMVNSIAFQDRNIPSSRYMKGFRLADTIALRERGKNLSRFISGSRLSDTITYQGRTTPYSFVTAIDTGFFEDPPSPGEIVINEWLAEDLNVKAGDSVELSYWIMGPMRSLKEQRSAFRVSRVIRMDEIPFGRALMPDFPGITAAGSCRDWETGSPVDLSRIRDKDEGYWKKYRGTPKAFIALETGRRLWGNPFGALTAFRFEASPDSIPAIAEKLMRVITPSEAGLVFRPVYQEGMDGAAHSTDFGGLFLGLGFFIIVAALILISLLFSMQISGRLDEAGLLLALGFPRALVSGLLMGEGAVVALIGSITGALAGILCNDLLLAGLNTLWLDAVNTSSLVPYIRISTLLTGAVSGLFIALLVQWGTLRYRRRMPASWLLKGVPGIPAKTGLRRPRNLATVILLAIGTFAVLVTGANRKNLFRETQRESGTGGFLLWAETTLPVVQDLNTVEGKQALNVEDDPVFGKLTFIPLQVKIGDDASCLNLNQVSRPALMGVPSTLFDSLRSFSFSALDPDADPDHPWMFLEQAGETSLVNGFADMNVITWGLQKKIGDTLRYTDENGDELLVRLAGGLENSIFQGYILIAGREFRRLYPSVSGARIQLIDSRPEKVGTGFGGSDKPGEQGHTQHSGSTHDPGPGSHGSIGRDGLFLNPDSVSRSLENALQDYGMMATPATQRLDSFNAVENTYLNVFMMLGGLGMILGTIGLGIILRRNIRERRGELSLLRALGYPLRTIRRMLFREYLSILFSGIALGLLLSLAVLLPSLFQPGYQVPLFWMITIVLLILISGVIWIWLPLHRALRTDLLKGFREE